MTAVKRDPLLMAAKIITGLLIGFIILAMVLFGIGAGAVLTVERGELLAQLAEADAPNLAYWALVGVLLALMGVTWLGYRFFMSLWDVIRSVDEGDPFRPANAELLARMGWISVGAQITLLIITLPATWLVSIGEKLGEDIHFSLDVGMGGSLLTLILFILARVFKHGAAMREDLEGTV